MTIELTTLCQCDCEDNQVSHCHGYYHGYLQLPCYQMLNSSFCNHRGDLTCGRCQCDATRLDHIRNQCMHYVISL